MNTAVPRNAMVLSGAITDLAATLAQLGIFLGSSL